MNRTSKLLTFVLATVLLCTAFTQSPDKFRSYKVYTAIISQQGEEAPTARVLENTLGVELTWARITNGMYIATSPVGVFPSEKTFILPMRQVQEIEPSLTFKVFAFYGNNRTVNVQTLPENSYFQDGLLRENPIEIRVYQ